MELELTSNLYQIVKWKAILGQCWPHKSSSSHFYYISSVHGLCGMWGMIAVGIFAREDTVSEGFTFNAYNGLLYGDYYLLGVQCLAVVSFAAWASLSTLVILRIIDAIFPIRAGLDFLSFFRGCSLISISYFDMFWTPYHM